MSKVIWLSACLNEVNVKLALINEKMITDYSLQVREEYVGSLMEKIQLEKDIFNAKKEDISIAIKNMTNWIEKEILDV